MNNFRCRARSPENSLRRSIDVGRPVANIRVSDICERALVSWGDALEKTKVKLTGKGLGTELLRFIGKSAPTSLATLKNASALQSPAASA